MTMRDQIIDVMDQITGTLLRKNEAYGNSAMDPVRIFSSSDATEQLKVRIDDKLSRLARGKNTDKVPEDTLMDLIGYLVLLVIAQGQDDEKVDKTTGSYTASFEVTDMNPDMWIALTKSNPQHGDEVTTFPVKTDPFWGREHP